MSKAKILGGLTGLAAAWLFAGTLQNSNIKTQRNAILDLHVHPKRIANLKSSLINIPNNTRTMAALNVIKDSADRAKDSIALTKIQPKLTTPQIPGILNTLRRP